MAPALQCSERMDGQTDWATEVLHVQNFHNPDTCHEDRGYSLLREHPGNSWTRHLVPQISTQQPHGPCTNQICLENPSVKSPDPTRRLRRLRQ